MIEEISHIELLHSILLNLGWKASEISEQKQIIVKKGGLNLSFYFYVLKNLENPELLILHPKQFQIASKKTFYERYLDIDYLIYALIELITEKYSNNIPMLLIDQNRAYLIDMKNMEVIQYCDSNKDQQEYLYPLLDRKKLMHGLTHLGFGKNDDAHGRELSDWIHLWSSEIGSRFDIKRSQVELFIKKIIFLRTFSLLFEELGQYLDFSSFLMADHLIAGRKSVPPKGNLKSVERAIQFLYNQKGIDYLNPGQETVYILNAKETKISSIVWKFFSDINLLSMKKFLFESLKRAFIPEMDRHKLLRARYTDSEVNIMSTLLHNDYIILNPVQIDIDEIGLEQTLVVFEKVVQYWMEYNSKLQVELRRGIKRPVVLDLFAENPDFVDENGIIYNIFAYIVNYSIQIKTSSSETKELAEFLIYLKMLFLAKKNNILVQTFPGLSKLWV